MTRAKKKSSSQTNNKNLSQTAIIALSIINGAIVWGILIANGETDQELLIKLVGCSVAGGLIIFQIAFNTIPNITKWILSHLFPHKKKASTFIRVVSSNQKRIAHARNTLNKNRGIITKQTNTASAKSKKDRIAQHFKNHNATGAN